MGLKYNKGVFLDNLIFLVIGNFLSCCFSKNFTVFELLRRPLIFKMQREKNFLMTKIPKGIPWTESVLKIDKVIATKVRDIPVQKGLKELDKNTDLFLVDVSFFEKNVDLNFAENILQTGELTYSPWYRFVNEPYKFDLDQTSTDYVAQAIAYVLKTQNINIDVQFKLSGAVSTVIVSDSKIPLEKIELEGENSISEIRIVGQSGVSVLNLESKKVSLYVEHSRLCYEALDRAHPTVFENMQLEKKEKNIELSYGK